MRSTMHALLFLTLAPFAVLADGASYSYLDVNKQIGGEVDVTGFGSTDTEGFGAKGSLGLGDHLFVELDYQTLQTDPDVGDFESTAFFVGLHGDTFYIKAGMEQVDFAGADDSGYTAEVGARMMPGESLELNLHYGMSDLGDAGTTVNTGVGAVIMFTANMGASINYDMRAVSDYAGVSGFDLDLTTYGVGFRLSFD